MPTPTTTTTLPLASACCAPLGAASLSDDEAQATAEVFKALADRHRVRIVTCRRGGNVHPADQLPHLLQRR